MRGPLASHNKGHTVVVRLSVGLRAAVTLKMTRRNIAAVAIWRRTTF
jgi:hypothetical protein